ncbi:GEVED domain-containing protein [Fibrella sp. WM1]|uniref:GEVED domain-containing protein n=1 Tax=Fibrella musci TaxID=3242485 RepID=UPI003522C734
MIQRYRFVIYVFFLVAWLPTYAQKKAPLLRCAAPELTDIQLHKLDREAQLALSLKQASGAFANLTYVPIRPHIFRSLLGLGGIDLSKLNRVLAATNRYYTLNGAGIQFYFAGSTPDYIDNDLYNLLFTVGLEDLIIGNRDAGNAMNLYMVNGFDDATLGGYAYFPANVLSSTRAIILNEADEFDLGNRLLPHELGHNFNLLHTHQGSTGPTPELVTRGAGANCTTAGDLVCDTPADPYGRLGASVVNVNGCPQYNGTATDPQGATYAPSITNLMSYYFPCTHEFTPGQFDRLAAGLALRQSHSAYSLSYPPTAVAAPVNLSAVLAANAKTVSLSWQDVANNEMGFFVERSTNPTNAFVAVGGTGPNQTTFVDAGVQSNVTYYYRIRPSNTTTGSLSPVVSIAVPVCRPTYSTSCSSTNGLARVVVNGVALSTGSGCAVSGYSTTTAVTTTVGAGQTIPVSASLLNAGTSLFAAVWVDLNRNGVYESTERLASRSTASTNPLALSITLPVSLASGQLPLRLVTATNVSPGDPCGSYAGGETEDYVLTVGTVVNCPTPTALTATNVASTSALINWSAASGPTSFGLQYRPSGASNWTITNVPSAPYTLTGLAAGASYEWQVLSVCGTAGSSPLSPVSSLTTPCAVPTNPTTSAIYGNSAQLNWGTMNTTYRLQWRPADNPTWATVPSVTGTTFAMTSLSVTTAYQWQVAAVCPSGVVSAFTNPVSFTTTDRLVYCQPPASSCDDGDGLASFRLGAVNLSNGSGCSAGGYQSFTAVSANLLPGQPYSFTATLLSDSWPEGLAIWVDLNRNGTLEPAERLYASPGTATGSLLGTLTIPAGTASGRYLLRARVSFDNVTTDPCGLVEFGETEDYFINVCSPPTAALTGSQTVTSGQTATLTAQLTGSSPWSLTVSGGVTFTNVVASPFTFTISPAVSTTYALSRVTNACGVGTVSGVASVTVVAPPVLMTDLSLAMLADRRIVRTGDTCTLTIVVSNEGPRSASAIMATSLLPPHMVFVGSGQAAVTSGSGAVSIAVGTLLPAESGTFSFSVRVTDPGTYRLAAQLTAASLPDPDSYLNSGTSDGDDDMALVDLRTSESSDSVYVSPNPNPRVLPAIQSNQPTPPATEADLSLVLWAGNRVPVSGSGLSLSVVVSNRGGLAATNVAVQLTLPVDWIVTNTAGLSVVGQVITLSIASIAVGQLYRVGIPVQVSGTGEQVVTAVITAATQPDSDSPHTNAYGRGEDDEASVSVRVQ